eukprot:4982682-Alexandrium_andersonii.AAC.1
MLRAASELEDEQDWPIPYSDRELMSSKQKYLSFVRQLDQCKLIAFTQQPKSFVGVFFVKKKTAGVLRMILDSRVPNRMFRKPPGVVLCSSEALGRIEWSGGA